MLKRTPARWWIPEDGSFVRCLLCPRQCRIAPHKRGFCGVRENVGGSLMSLVYGYPVAMQNDPSEKKPLHHFLPRTRIFSIGTFGCTIKRTLFALAILCEKNCRHWAYNSAFGRFEHARKISQVFDCCEIVILRTLDFSRNAITLLFGFCCKLL